MTRNPKDALFVYHVNIEKHNVECVVFWTFYVNEKYDFFGSNSTLRSRSKVKGHTVSLMFTLIRIIYIL